MTRALALALVSAACNSTTAMPPVCGSASFTFTSPCGFESVTTTCPQGASCFDAGTEGYCTVGMLTASCSVTVVLGDGTQHTFDVTLGPTSDPACQDAMVVTSAPPDFASPTCVPPPDDGGSES